MNMAHNAIAALRKLEVLHRLEKGLRLQFDGLRQEPSGSRSQDICQWLVNVTWLAKRKNVGYSRSWRIALLERFWQASTPTSIRRLSR
jgi:hypothetical protein